MIEYYRFIESKMVELIPTLKANHRVETLKYLEIITPEETQVADANLIAFRNRKDVRLNGKKAIIFIK